MHQGILDLLQKALLLAVDQQHSYKCDKHQLSSYLPSTLGNEMHINHPV